MMRDGSHRYGQSSTQFALEREVPRQHLSGSNVTASAGQTRSPFRDYQPAYSALSERQQLDNYEGRDKHFLFAGIPLMSGHYGGRVHPSLLN